MKILAIMGSPRKLGNTYLVTKCIEEKLKQLDSTFEVEYLFLQDADLKICSGCRLCFDQGEACCPHRDDIPAIVARILQAEGVIFASPTYVGNMTGLMKNLMDRLAYFCHRPAFFHKKALLVSTTGSAGVWSALVMMSIPVGTWGFQVTGKLGLVMNTGKVIPVPEKYSRKIDRVAAVFYKNLREKKCSPNVFSLVAFQANRKYHQGKVSYDAQYWREKGWLEPSRKYFIPARINIINQLMANIIAKLLRFT
jgi:multimeric flavodoxin WrbA